MAVAESFEASEAGMNNFVLIKRFEPPSAEMFLDSAEACPQPTYPLWAVVTHPILGPLEAQDS